MVGILLKSAKFLARPDIFFLTLVWMMLVLVLGTLEQKYAGLYAAQQKYFSAFIFWEGPVPLPAGYTIIGIVSLQLLCKLLVGSPWRRQDAGIIIVHIGALLLLLGAALTAFFSYEGNMVLHEEQSADYIADYYELELAVEDPDISPPTLLALFAHDQLKRQKPLKNATLPFTITPQVFCENCAIQERDETAEETTPRRGMAARKMDIRPIPLNPQDKDNRPGILFNVSGASEEQDGNYMSFAFIPRHPKITVDGKTYAIMLRHKRTPLPFSITLKDFHKEYHPATNTPRAYRSDVLVKDGELQWETRIEMNEPLRYKGYTFYQSAFVVDESGEASILAVVHNVGRIFPYVSSIVMCIGLLLHLFMQLPRLIRKS
ncbi:MAG: cytochrome c biogenesis protein ResB [Hyphomicrobiales bacterium]|nr:cytochrome c biogenesis protein ResB [Hyphomicrobiales bacterium]